MVEGWIDDSADRWVGRLQGSDEGRRSGQPYRRWIEDGQALSASRTSFDPKEKGVDLTKPLYFATYGEWTKKEGLARVTRAAPARRTLVCEDAKLSFAKARDADTFIFTRQTYVDFPDYWLANAAFGSDKPPDRRESAAAADRVVAAARS